MQNSVMQLGKALLRMPETEVDVLGVRDEHTAADSALWSPLAPRALLSRGPRKLLYCPHALSSLCEMRPDLVHCHGLWVHFSHVTAQWAKVTHRPYLISPRGMLEPRLELRKSRVQKAIALLLYQRQHLKSAACMHALSLRELEEIRQFGQGNPVCVIPNGISLPDPTGHAQCDPPWQQHISPEFKVLLFISRINPKKGLTQLVNAVHLVAQQDRHALRSWRVAVSGWDQGGYENVLKTRVAQLGLNAYIHFIGPVFNVAKDTALRSASAFVLPSLSEGLPMAVLEAWSYGLPVLMTPQCNIPEGFATSAAIKADPTPESLAASLRTLFEMSDADRRAMGHRGLRLVQEQFTWSKVAADMRSVYDWLLGGGSAPSCVQVN